MNAKQFFLGCSIALVLTVLFGAVGGFILYQRYVKPLISQQLVKPAVFDSPQIAQGSEALNKSVFASGLQLGTITDIRSIILQPENIPAIAAVSSKGVVFLDQSGAPIRRMGFAGEADHVDMIETQPSQFAFMNRGSWGISTSLIDMNGNQTWKYGGPLGVNDMSAGDMNGDGELEYVVGFNGGGGIHLLNAKGAQLWRQNGANIWHVEIVDTTGNGTMQIVHSDAAGTMTVRDAKGSIVNQSSPGPYFSHFSICPWPTSADRSYALLAENEIIWLFDYNGSAVAQYTAPDCGTLGHARGMPAKMGPAKEDCLAVIVDFSNWQSALFYVYDSSRKLIFKEVMPESCSAIATLKDDKTDSEMILIGGTDQIWLYRRAEN